MKPASDGPGPARHQRGAPTAQPSRRGNLEISAAREIVDQVALLPIRIDPSPPQPAALLSLALRLQLPIATRDGDLAEAAWAAGVGVLAG
jgi:hypothetical protein